MAAFEIDVNGTTYRGETAPATMQWEALEVAANSRLIIGIKEDVSDQGLALTVMGVPREGRDKLVKLLLEGKTPVVRADDRIPVAVSLFQDKPAEFALLLGKVARENLRGFYSLRSDSAGAAEQSSSQA